ncbi:Nif11 family protein [Halieaceae bacterium IMCC8485]|uniref:Nif11 family protein n=1 Tax=Candidatus Seongchinamella marina TaxID=2518990 RepID=A0ABT3T044_9GAMM|nr:Nif11 family protein [Candidatus Seongchinamella marina]
MMSIENAKALIKKAKKDKELAEKLEAAGRLQ